MSRTLRVASAQYAVSTIADFASFAAKFGVWVDEAVTHGASLLVFPEYFSMELARTSNARTLADELETMQSHYHAFRTLIGTLARDHRVTICAGTYPVRDDDGRVRNRCLLALADGRIEAQDKLTMTRFENEQWLVSPGAGTAVFDIGAAPIGIAICYDSEFPAIAKRLCEHGAEILLVPSCTDTLAGYHRVRIGCQARALENQCYVVQSPTVGTCPGSLSIDENIGAAAVFSPPDDGFNDDGIVAMGTLNVAQWLYADLDLDLIADVRANGRVLNFADRDRAKLD